MGSAQPTPIKSLPNLPLQPQNTPQPVQQTKTEAPLQQIQSNINNINKEYHSLKTSHSVNLEKTKNEAKIKKVKDIRSLQSLKDINVQNIQNQQPIPELNNQEIEDVSILKKTIKQLNPVTKKKLASDRIMISYQSKTQNVISSASSQNNDIRTSLQSRAKKCRVSKML